MLLAVLSCVATFEPCGIPGIFRIRAFMRPASHGSTDLYDNGCCIEIERMWVRMATVGENIKRYRKARGLSVVGLAGKVGMTEGAIRHYESGIRAPGDDRLKKIAEALDMSEKMLEDHKIASSKDLVGALLQLEEEFGLVPDMCDGGLSVDPTAKHAQKLDAAIKAWGAVRHKLITGEITQEEYDAWKRKF